MRTISRQSAQRLVALTQRRNAFFTFDDLCAYLSQNPDVDADDYADIVTLQLDTMSALRDFLAAREIHGHRNVMESIMGCCATMALALGKTCESAPMPSQDIATQFNSACAHVFYQNLSIPWEIIPWIKPPTHTIPHSTN